ncbi:MAG: Maf-like protein [Gammaproteobacteria bacterium]|nr:Maf-like protein [Gammaproteobacteria bacterium]
MTSPLSIVLASGSPRRHELLLQLGITHKVLPVDVEEVCQSSESADECVQRLALEKARTAFLLKPRALVIGSDTMVIINGKILGKPRDRADGLQMLECLSGREHEVLTAVALVGAGRELSGVQRSKVRFRQLSYAEIEAYWETGEPHDKAGSYAIQGRAAQFIESLEGSFSGVMGLPLYETAQLLREFGINPLEVSNA